MRDLRESSATARAVLFDLDGTLIDSAADLAAAANHVRAGMGLAPLATDVVRGHVGDGARKLVLRVLDHREDRVDDGLRQFRAYYRDHLLDRTVPYPGVVDGLARLRDQGLPMAVVTNKPQAFVSPILEGLAVDRCFGSVVGARPGLPVKPDPALLRVALKELQIPSSDWARCWMVGDSPNDILSGRALGCHTVAVGYGLKPVEVLRQSDPGALVESFEDLLALLEAPRRSSP